jgi:hypothetical protein
MSLKSLDGTHEKFFKVFKDEDLGLDFSRLERKESLIIEAHQDDDVETEHEVLDNGR